MLLCVYLWPEKEKENNDNNRLWLPTTAAQFAIPN